MRRFPIQFQFSPLTWAVLASSLVTLVLQLWLCFFFSGGAIIPRTIDNNPSNYATHQFQVPPHPVYDSSYWLGQGGALPVLTPLSIFAHVPAWWFFTCFYPLCAALALLTAYYFLRVLELSGEAAWFGGVVYAWQGPLLSNIFPGHFNPAVLWVIFPLALATARRAVDQRDLFWAALAGGLCGWMVALSPDRGGLSSGLVGAYYGFEVWRTRTEGWAMLVQRLSYFVMLVTVALVVAAPVLVGTVQQNVQAQALAPESAGEGYAWATQWSYPPEDYLNYLVPGLFGFYSGAPTAGYWGRIGRSADWTPGSPGFRNFMLDTFTVGTLATTFALFGLAWALQRLLVRRNPLSQKNESRSRVDAIAMFFAVTFLVCAILALGRYTSLYEYFYRLPLMASWRNPLKFLTPGNLGLTVLVAYGWERWQMDRMAGGFGFTRFDSWGRVLLLLLGFFIGLALITGFFLQAVLATQGYAPAEASSMAGNLIKALFMAWALLWAARWLMRQTAEGTWWQRRVLVNPWLRKLKDFALHPHHQTMTLVVLLGGLNVLQMMWVHRHFMSPFPFRAYYQSNPMIADLKLSGEPVRVKIFQEDPLLHQYLSTLFPYYGVESLDVSAASRTPADYRAFFDALKDQPSRFWLLGGVRYLAVNGDELARLQADPALVSNVHQTYFYRADGTSLEQIDLKKVNRSQGFSHAVVEFKDFLPRVSLVPQVRVVKDGAEVLKVLTEPKFRPQDTMVVTTAEGPAGWPEKSTGAVAPIKIQHYEPGRMEWQTELTQPGLVLINQRFEAGWRAEINGKPVPIFRANYLMMGLSVPPGKCAVVLQYAPSLKTVYASTAVWLLLGFWAWQRERRRRY